VSGKKIIFQLAKEFLFKEKEEREEKNVSTITLLMKLLLSLKVMCDILMYQVE
jgi:hypothetical protein